MVFLSWADSYAVMRRDSSSGWVYVAKYISKKDAKKLLQETDLTASAIGEACGYKDHVLFFKSFKKQEGITPIAFRKKTQKTPRREIDKAKIERDDWKSRKG